MKNSIAVFVKRLLKPSPLCWLWQIHYTHFSPSSSFPLEEHTQKRKCQSLETNYSSLSSCSISSGVKRQGHRKGNEAPTKGLVHHRLLLLLFLTVLIHQRSEGISGTETETQESYWHFISIEITWPPPPAPPLLHPSTHSSICHLHPPLVISWWPPQEHDDQQDHGEQETPEGIINPELPPVLHTHSHITAALTTIFFTGAFFFLITRTHRQTFGHLKNLCGPDDEDDWSWKNKENHMSFFTSKKTHCNSKLDTFVPMTANMSVLVKCL